MEQVSHNPKVKTGSLLTTLILSLAVLLVWNLLSSFFFYRLDLSKGKVHTLSKVSKNLTKGLKDKIVVQAYFSKNLTPEYNVLARYAKDLLSEYKLYGRGKFYYEIINRSNEAEFKAEAERNNVIPQKVLLLENDQQSIREIYLGIAFEYKGNRETLNLTKDIEGRLEYEITATLRRLIKTGLPSVSVYQDSLYSPRFYTYFEHAMSQNYKIKPISLKEPVMASQVMVFPGVIDSLSKIQLYNLDQFIMHGGKVIFFLDRVAGLVQYNKANEIYSNVFRLLEHYGVEIKPNLVMDHNCASINLSQRSGIFVIDVPMPFPPIPRVNGMKEQIISRDLSDIYLYLCSEINPRPKNNNITVTPILQTSPNSGIISGPDYDISPDRFLKGKLMASLIMPPKTVAALVNGKFTSFFAKDPDAQKTKGFIAQNTKAQIIVVSDADMIRDNVAAYADVNLLFMLNAIDFLMGDTSLITVRSRQLPNSILDVNRWLIRNNVEVERAAEIESIVKQIIKGINILLPSILLILMGIIQYYAQKKRSKSIQRQFELSLPMFGSNISSKNQIFDKQNNNNDTENYSDEPNDSVNGSTVEYHTSENENALDYRQEDKV